jgi:hypothetical protein
MKQNEDSKFDTSAPLVAVAATTVHVAVLMEVTADRRVVSSSGRRTSNGDGLPDGLELTSRLGVSLGRLLLNDPGCGSDNLLLSGRLGLGRGGAGHRVDGVLNNVGGLLEIGQARQTSRGGRGGGLRGLRSLVVGTIVATTIARVRVATVGPSSDGVVSGQLRHGSSDLFIKVGLDSAVNSVLDSARAFGEASMLRVTVVNNVLEEVLVPAGHEVGVRAVASGITVGENEGVLGSAAGAVPLVRKFGGVPVDLEEHVGNVGVALGAVVVAFIVDSWPVHVVLVVIQAGLGIVARRKVKVGTEGRGVPIAVMAGETNTDAQVGLVANAGRQTIRTFRPVKRVVIFARAGEVDVVNWVAVMNEVLGGASLRRRALERVSNKHRETKREGLKLIQSLVKEVVNVHVEDFDAREVARVGVLEVKGWEPVVAEVALNVGVGALGVDEVLALGVDAEATSSHNGMDVAGGLTRVDDGVHAAGDEALVGEAHDGKGTFLVEGEGRASEGRHGKSCGGLHFG